LPYDSVDIVHGSEPLIFSWVSPNGIVVKKEFFFSPETYLIGLTISVKNNSMRPLGTILYYRSRALQVNKKADLVSKAPVCF